MSIGRAVQVPESLVWAVANALIPPKTQREEAKGWFNKFVRLENIGSPDRFITEIERILSRATYDPQGVVRTIESKEGKTYPLYNPSKEDIEVVRSLIAHDERTFRAFKAVFLMEVLSKLRASGGAEAEGESEEKAKED
ncbi:MAG: hypothetical protein GWN86_08140 [Desulfobacterales bacterium]|nr:hypothetical protein [Desulfobacterales bacterium]